ncbi:MAG TPA: endo-1,4-beta-xylanase [Saprospiraceae bacterium]|nr:endo-1,4-beta-xylanase [Saprospiraceae bacterium]
MYHLKQPISFLILLIGFSFISCKQKEGSIDEKKGLKTVFADDFLIGAAINADQIMEKDTNALSLLPSEFNSITPENIMKCEIVHPEWDKYNFDLADKIVALGDKNDMFTVGHTLVWHSQLSPFVTKIKSKDSLTMFLENHINTIASRYDGKIEAWDVVNEALNEDGTMRKTIFLDLLGDDFVTNAFRLAQKATPNSELYYNDYNIEQPKKRAGAIELIKKIQAAGVRIDGVGIQGHWSIKGLPLEDIEQSILEYAALGIKVMFTEVDITVLPNPWDLQGADVNQNFEGSPMMNPYPELLPDSIQVALADEYGKLFNLFLKHKDKISRVTFWGISDANSWLNGWPIKGRTNYPLLFDRNYLPKPAYDKVVSTKRANVQGS